MTGDGFLYLDAELRLSRFTSRAASLVDIGEENLGEHIAQLLPQFGDADPARDARHALCSEKIIEREVQSDDGRWIHFGYRPYRSAGAEGASGVVVALTDLQCRRGDASDEWAAPPLVPDSALDTTIPPHHREGRQTHAQGSDLGGNMLGERAMDIAVLERQLEEQAGEIRALSRELALAERNERSRIARLLHDEFQQLLYALKIRIEAVLAGASLESHGDVLRELVEQASSLTRSLVVSLAPPIYESDDLIASLDWLADYVGDRYGVKVEIAYDQAPPLCEEERRVLLFEVVRELLFNVVKHAGTERARVRVQEAADHIIVVVEDDGKGFDVASMSRGAQGNPHQAGPHGDLPEGGFGLNEVRRRLRLLGGWLDVESEPGAGTRASAAVPFDHAPSSAAQGGSGSGTPRQGR